MIVPASPRIVSDADVPPERLAGNSALTEAQKLHEASRQFEAILLRQILAASQKTVIQSKLANNSTASEIYRDMVCNQLADSISKSGAFGLAKTFEEQLRATDRGDKAERRSTNGLSGVQPGKPSDSHS